MCHFNLMNENCLLFKLSHNAALNYYFSWSNQTMIVMAALINMGWTKPCMWQHVLLKTHSISTVLEHKFTDVLSIFLWELRKKNQPHTREFILPLAWCYKNNQHISQEADSYKFLFLSVDYIIERDKCINCLIRRWYIRAAKKKISKNKTWKVSKKEAHVHFADVTYFTLYNMSEYLKTYL